MSFCTLLGFRPFQLELFGMNGGDDGARTRDLCRDSFQRPEELMVAVSVSLLCPGPLPW